MIKQAIEHNTIEGAIANSALIQTWAESNVPEYNATSWCEPYPYNDKFYIFVDERVYECPDAQNWIYIDIINNDVF